MSKQDQPNFQITTSDVERRPDLDWIRVCVVILLVFNHAARIFDPDPLAIVYVKKQIPDFFLISFQHFLTMLQMPVLFFIAGMSVWYALGKRSPKEFVIERCRRLGVPLAFAIFVLIPPMIYINLLEFPITPPSFLQFYIGFFTISPMNGAWMYDGEFRFAHLWFVLYLLIFSLILLPLFVHFRNWSQKNHTGKGKSLKQIPSFILIFPGLVLAVISLFPGITSQNVPFYAILFIFGFMAAKDNIIQDTIIRIAPVATVLGIGSYLVNELFFPTFVPLSPWTIQWILQGFNYNAGCWFWTIAIIGFGRKYITKNRNVLRYASEASYPFYIIHFLILTIIGYFVIQLPVTSTVMYIIIVPTTILATFITYDLIIRRNKLGRFLFGMNNKKTITKENFRN